MKITKTLPEGYKAILAVDLEKNKKCAFGIHAASILITLVMVVGMNFLTPISTLFEKSMGAGGLILRLVVLALLFIAYIVLHELTHGVTMKLLGCKKVTYGFSGLYAFAGCREFFTKKAYITVALAPVVLWGIVLTIASYLVSASWFWIIYIVQITNISGAVGDFYVTFRFLGLHEDALIYDKGTEITVFAPMANEDLT